MTGTFHHAARKRAHRGLILVLITVLAQPSTGQDFWTSMGPRPGSATMFAVNQINEVIYSVEAGRSGVTLSSDGGANWSHTDWGAFNNSVAVNSKGHIFLGSAASFWRSTSFGTSWDKVNFPKPPILSLFITSSGKMLAGTGANGIYGSTDDGTSWTKLALGVSDDGVHIIRASRMGTLFCVTADYGLLRSTDDGLTWQTTDLAVRDISALAFDSDGNGWVGSKAGVFLRSSDDGSHWIEVQTGLAPAPMRAIFVSDQTGILLGREGEELLRSFDQGRSWSPAGGSGSFSSFRTIIALRGDTLVAGTMDGLARSTDAGRTWQAIGIASGTILDMSAQPDGTLFMAFYGARCKISHDHCETFLDLGPTDFANHAVCLGFNRNGHIFVGMNEGLYRSTNRGESWKRIGDVLPSTYIHAMAFDAHGNLYVGTEAGLSRSTNNGDDWSPRVLIEYIHSLVIPSDSVIIAGAGGGIYRSSDGAKTWSLVKTAPPPGKEVHALLAFDAVTLYAAWGDVGMIVSTDAGISWTTPPTMGNCATIHCLRRDANGTIYAATDYGIFISHDRWKSWTNPHGGMRIDATKSVAVDRDGYLYAGTAGGGVYRSARPVTAIRTPHAAPISPVVTLSIFPNPSSGNATVEYSLPAAGHVRLELFDMLGRLLSVWEDADRDRGEYRLPCATSNLPPGCYLCRLTTVNSATSRMIVSLR